MANETVYPYGIGGTLPASIGIVNDLRTGGADKALSAQQGVVLRGMAQKSETIDISTMGIVRGVIASNGNWSGAQTNHQSIQIPVIPGQTYRITANASNSSFYAFLAGFSQWVASGTPNYATGESGRYEIVSGVTVEITIPSGAYYLYLAISNAGTNQQPQSVVLLETINDEDTKVDELRKRVIGGQTNYCNYATDSFTFTGTSAQGTVEKVGTNGYLITNIAKTSGKYFLYTIPSGLVDGKTYLLTFKYSSWLSADWGMNVVRSTSSEINSPQRYATIPATGVGRVSFRYTYINGDTYFRLASASVNGDCSVLIEDLSIFDDMDEIPSITQRLDAIDGGQNMGGTFYNYVGRRIDLTEHGYTFSEYLNSIGANQSAACYGDYMFVFTDKMATIKMYNLRTRSLLATVTQTALDELHHCNQSFFGTEKYDSDDVFPLVYLTVNNNGTTAGGYMEAYRIVPVMGDSDYSSFTITLVQTVTLPIMTEDNKLGNANYVLDTDSGYLYTYSRYNSAPVPICRITRWPMPKFSDGNVTYTDDDRLAYWDTDTEAANMQGAAIRNSQLFIFRGGGGVGYVEAHIFDLVRMDRIAFLDLLSAGFSAEPEGVFLWGNTLCTTTYNGKVFRYFFK